MNRIFTFTGTGNSVAIARTLADSLDDTEIVPIAKLPGGYTAHDEDRIGLVFPVFAWGMPRMVAKFVRSLNLTPKQYVFAIATCGGTPGRTLVQLDKALRRRGARLDAGFTVSGDFLISVQSQEEMALIKFVSWLGRNHVPQKASDRLPEMAKVIQSNTAHPIETSNLAVNIVGSMLYGFSMKMFRTMDKAYASTAACVGCGICANLCPRENITLKDGAPLWHHDCEYCFACMAWCPHRAIAMKGGVPSDPTHHPHVTLNDVLLRQTAKEEDA